MRNGPGLGLSAGGVCMEARRKTATSLATPDGTNERTVAMAASPRGPDRSHSNKYVSFGAKIAKIGPVDPEIICLHLKKKDINASKIYSPVGKFAERAKNVQ